MPPSLGKGRVTNNNNNKIIHYHFDSLENSTLGLNRFPARATYFSSHQTQTNATQLAHSTSVFFVSGMSEKIKRVLNEQKSE